ncbi:MAG: hypothetical protein HY554_12815 [Elusimicrobia bacterium]|nr:hypothetical protein [Elusimicrobiota bacterium]
MSQERRGVGMRRLGWGLMALGLLTAVPAAAGEEKALAKRFAKAAARADVRRLAVLPFVPADDSDAREGRLLAEELTGRLAERSEVVVVERGLLEEVLRELRLGETGLLDRRSLAKVGRLLQAQAIVVGTYTGLGLAVRLEARLVSVETGAVVAAGRAKLQREAFAPAAGLFAPSVAITADSVAAELLAYAETEELPAARAAEDRLFDALAPRAERSLDCRDAARRADELQRRVLDLKARYWASKAKEPGFAPSSLPVKPGATLTDPSLRTRFFSLMQTYARGPEQPLDAAEIRRFVSADGDAFRLLAGCGLVSL